MLCLYQNNLRKVTTVSPVIFNLVFIFNKGFSLTISKLVPLSAADEKCIASIWDDFTGRPPLAITKPYLDLSLYEFADVVRPSVWSTGVRF